MLTAELRVNCGLIGHIYIVNEKDLGYDTFNTCQYRYEYYELDKEIKRGRVVHDRDEGALELIKKVIEDIEEK